MKITQRASRRATLATASIGALALLVGTAGTAQAAATPVDLGTADSFAILAGAGVTNTGLTSLDGSLGTTPTPSVTGIELITFESGTYVEDAGVVGIAKNDLQIAFNAASQPTDVTVSANLGGQGLVAGVYFQASTMYLTGPALTLDAGGNPDAVWIFRAGSDLIVGPGASVNLINGAQACNVWWQVASSASLDDGADFVGTIMAQDAVTLNAGAKVEGRALALTKNVTLINNTFTRPSCTTPVSSDTTSGDATTGITDGTGGTTGTGGTGTAGPTGTDTTSGQVTAVPSGSVATGDGSTSPMPFDALLVAGVVTIGAGAAALVVNRRRELVA